MNVLKPSFSYSAARLWSSVPANARATTSFKKFKDETREGEINLSMSSSSCQKGNIKSVLFLKIDFPADVLTVLK